MSDDFYKLTPPDDDQQKRIIKEALKEWLDEKFAAFGKWSFFSLAAAGLAALVFFILWVNGWHK
jgi:hypothetical protein